MNTFAETPRSLRAESGDDAWRKQRDLIGIHDRYVQPTPIQIRTVEGADGRGGRTRGAFLIWFNDEGARCRWCRTQRCNFSPTECDCGSCHIGNAEMAGRPVGDIPGVRQARPRLNIFAECGMTEGGVRGQDRAESGPEAEPSPWAGYRVGPGALPCPDEVRTEAGARD